MRVVTIARKPVEGTTVQSVTVHQTGALNVDACRIEYEAGGTAASNPLFRLQRGYKVGGGIGFDAQKQVADKHSGKMPIGGVQRPPNLAGRWPTNVIVQGDEVAGALEGDVSRFFKQFRFVTPTA